MSVDSSECLWDIPMTPCSILSFEISTFCSYGVQIATPITKCRKPYIVDLKVAILFTVKSVAPWMPQKVARHLKHLSWQGVTTPNGIRQPSPSFCNGSCRTGMDIWSCCWTYCLYSLILWQVVSICSWTSGFRCLVTKGWKFNSQWVL